MRLLTPRALFRPALLLGIAIGVTTAATPLTATAAASRSSVVVHPVTDVGTASQVPRAIPSAARVAAAPERGATRAAAAPERGVHRPHAISQAAAARAGVSNAPTASSNDQNGDQSGNGASGRLLRHFNCV